MGFEPAGPAAPISRRPMDWPGIARDLVLASVDGGGAGQAVTYGDVIGHWGLTPSDVAFLSASESFRGLLRAERKRASELGGRAAFTFKAEQMALALAEELFRRLSDPDGEVTVGELRQGFETLARAAGLSQPPEAKAAGPGAAAAGAVNIQINVPELPGGKLGHMRKGIEPDGEG